MAFEDISQEDKDFLFSMLDKHDRGEEISEEEMWKYLAICYMDHPMDFYAGYMAEMAVWIRKNKGA